MYDFAFDWRNLNREFLRSDFSGNPSLVDHDARRLILDAAVSEGRTGFQHLALDTATVRGKKLYQPMLLPQELLLRKLSRNVKLLTKVRQTDRDTTIKSLEAIFSEGHDFRVYKLDISQFYESIDRGYIRRQFESDAGFPSASLHLFRSLSNSLATQSILGLPRGLAISATLSEYAMRNFDSFVRSQPQVYFYARYVDDIIIVSRGDEDKRAFMRRIRKELPTGLSLNPAKSKVRDFVAAKANTGHAVLEHNVDFLGYQFAIFGKEKTNSPRTGLKRRVYIDVAPNKVKRFKTRIILSFREFNNSGSFDDLHDRLKLLTGNYNIYDFEKQLRRNVGIYWNYRHVNVSPSPSMAELDKFIAKVVLSGQGPVGGPLQSALASGQRKSILALSFQRSFSAKSFYHFNAARLAHLVGTWTYA